MNEAISNFIAMCEWDTTRYFIISENVFSHLVYYSHLLPLVVSIIFGVFIFLQNRKLLSTKSLLITSVFIVLWLFFDLILWATDRPEFTMFFWSLVNMFEPMIYAGVLYFVYTFIKGEDLPFRQKLILILLLLPTVILTSTSIALVQFDLSNCDREAIEGPLVYYGYIIELVFTIWILTFGIREFVKEKVKHERSKIALVTFGSVLLLLSFATGNVIGSLFVNWTIGQYGLFGIPIFIGLLSYLIVKFKAFNIRLIGAQALVVTLWIAVFAILFIRFIEVVRIVVALTLVLIGILGIMLVKGVKKERNQLERISQLASDLEKANAHLKVLDKQKTEFVSLASHQLRAPMTAVKGYTAMILDGDYGEVPEKIKEPIQHIFASTQSLIQIVNDFLDVTRIELGTMKFSYSEFDLGELVKDVIDELQPNINLSKLEFKFEGSNAPMPVHGDEAKIKQVLNNLIDNALKYTKRGWVHVKLERTSDMYRFTVQDTGVGISADALPKLFEKFVRAENANEANVLGTGLGLFVAKQMIEKHSGRIWAESEGEGKGSKFIVEIPAK